MRRIIALLSVLLLLISLAGCGLLEKSYSVVSQHVPQTSSGDETGAIRAENYTELVSGVQYFVSAGVTEGSIHLYHYTGDIEADLAAACHEVLTEDPLGSFALSDITYVYSRIISYYECSFTLEYAHTQEEIDSIVSAGGISTLKSCLSEAVTTFADTLILEVSSYYAGEEEILSLIWEAYYDSPATALGYPKVEVTVYAPAAVRPIVEITFTYEESQSVLTAQARQVSSAAVQLAGQQTGQDSTAAWLLYSRLEDSLIYDSQGSSSVYAALVEGTANSESAALAYQLLCQLAGIDCLLVEGTLDGQAHCWNMVELEGVWWHTDVTANAQQENFLASDDAFAVSYSWAGEGYPECPGDASGTVDGEDAAAAVGEESLGALAN